MPDIAQQSSPGFFFCLWFASDVTRDFRIGPHCGAMDEIFEAVGAEFQALGLEGGHFDGAHRRGRHRRSLWVLECCVKREELQAMGKGWHAIHISSSKPPAE